MHHGSAAQGPKKRLGRFFCPGIASLVGSSGEFTRSATATTLFVNQNYLACMHRFDKERVSVTLQYIVHLLSSGGIEHALRGGKPSRCAVDDLHAVLAEYGQCFTLPPKHPKTYLTTGEGEPAELYADIRLCVDGAPSDLVLRCTLFAEQNAGHYAYRIDDLLAP